MSLTIAVTGACGNLGSAVCKLALEEGHTVIGLDLVDCTLVHPNFTAKVVNTCQYRPFMDAVQGCDALVHLAAMLPVVASAKASVQIPQEVSTLHHYFSLIDGYYPSFLRLSTMTMLFPPTTPSR